MALACLFLGVADLSLCCAGFFASGPLQQLDSRGIYSVSFSAQNSSGASTARESSFLALMLRTATRQLANSPLRVLLSGGLEPQTARELTVPVETTLAEGTRVVRNLEVFIVRGEDEKLAAYENYCPHAGGPLNWLPDKFLSRSKRHLLCTRHGAHFAIHDGVCVRGPCVGTSLNPLPITVDAETGDVCVSEQSLLDLCANGGGAFIEEEVACDSGGGGGGAGAGAGGLGAESAGG